MIRGVSLKIPNQHGRFLRDLLKPFGVSEYDWWVGGEESYLIVDGEFEPLFPGLVECMEGDSLKRRIEGNEYYLIFQDLKAFPKGTKPIEITTYSEFMNSDCELTLLVIDSSYIAIYCKDTDMTRKIYDNAKELDYTKVAYITEENDFRTRLTVW
ncbi:DUF2691 family protein [Saccharibacillus kuerlensis]|uniref:DUF2691 family protein n=1 Tax=Saccharibacillus kuerlensis TaxID=459527 RepID=A0ABQ2L372_9BACL|nr:DUF2691 family protein [Saccharibacillus kuerlensis]GGO01028.1 hypothetical protein GCM10010969_22870 [Saccharibacillus kuerlensis]